VSSTIDTFWHSEYEELVERALSDAPVLRDLRRARVPAGDPRRLVLRHYAEVSTSLNLKLPSRLRLCPPDAVTAKQFLWRLYAEEQGDFQPGADHASLFARFCRSLGLTDDDMAAEWEHYWPAYRYMLTDLPSHSVLVRELTICPVWESVILRLGAGYLQAIQQAFPAADPDFTYFTVHATVDTHHSVAALSVLQEYVRSDEDLAIVRTTVQSTLVTDNPWAIRVEADGSGS